MYGIIIAFKNFSMRKGIWGSPWAGLENFTRLFGSACANSSNSGESSTADVSNGFGQADSTQAELYYNLTGYPICDETISVSVTGPLGFTQDWNNTYQVKGIEEKFGIHLDGNPISTDAWSNQLTLLLATDDLPDLILKANMTFGDVSKYGAEEYFLALNKYEDLMPNLKTILEAYPEYKSAITSSDGNIYGFATLTGNEIRLITRFFMDNRWLENVNMEMPTTIDELYDVLVAFKEQEANGNGDPSDEIPLSFCEGGIDTFSYRALMAAFGVYGSWSELILSVNDQDKVYLAETTDNYKAFLTFMKKLYAEALLDKECFIQTGDEFNAKVAAGRVGLFGCWAPYLSAGQQVPYDKYFSWVGGLTSDVCENPGIALSSSVASSFDTLINSKTQYPEAIVRLLDYFWSEDGATDGFGGREGETYDLVDCAGHKMIQMRCPGGYTSGDEFRGAEAIIHTAFSYYLNAQNTQLGLPLVMSDEELDTYIDEIGWPAMMEKGLRAIDNLEKVSAYPILGYTEEEVAKRTTYVTDITSQIKSYRTKFITGELDIEKDWDSFLTSLDQMGLQELLSIEQSAYDR